MITIKSYTDIEQSRKLAEILPLESADMYWDLLSRDKFARVNNIGCCLCRSCVYAWSLAALLDVLPEYNLQKTDWENKTEYKIVVTVNEDDYASKNYDNPIDACYEVIIKLYELKML